MDCAARSRCRRRNLRFLDVLLFEKTRPDILTRKKAEVAVKSAVFK
jgi:hypothetical protein